MVSGKINHSRLLVLLLITALLTACETPKAQSRFAALLVQEGKAVTHPATLRFPQDHLSHPEFGIEWWYLTANLADQQGEPIWLQWTLFRIKNKGGTDKGKPSQQTPNSWDDGQFFMAHFSLHSQQQHFSREVFASGGVGNAGVDEDAIGINNWKLNKSASGLPSGLTLSFFDNKTAADVTVQLELDTQPDYLLHGDAGYSLKHPDTRLASYYYSLPNIRVTGSVSFSDSSQQINSHQVKGQAWYDHEWSSMFLSEDFSGWNWFSIHLEDGSKLTLFTLLPARNAQYAQSWYGALMSADGAVAKLSNAQIQVTETQHQDSQIGKIPTQWRIGIEDALLDLRVAVRKPNQVSPFSIPYYEGAITVTGSKSGTGFVELTR